MTARRSQRPRRPQSVARSGEANSTTSKEVYSPLHIDQELPITIRPTFTWGPFKEGELLNLPREIRDQIYGYILDAVTMNLKIRGVNVFASHPSHIEADPHRAWHAAKGLPTWLLVCKQMSGEGAELIARNWRFRPLGRFPLDDAVSAAVANPLIFHAHGPQHIIIRPTIFIADNPLPSDSAVLYRSDTRETEAVPKFVKILRELEVSDLCLETTWERWWHIPSQNGFHATSSSWSKDEPDIFHKEWDSSWDGNFREVAITVKVWSDPNTGNISSELMSAAEYCARNLVGWRSETIWKNFGMAMEDGEPTWTRRVVVKRKI